MFVFHLIFRVKIGLSLESVLRREPNSMNPGQRQSREMEIFNSRRNTMTSSRSLNRIRTRVGRRRANLKMLRYFGVLLGQCDCGEEQTVDRPSTEILNASDGVHENYSHKSQSKWHCHGRILVGYCMIV